MIPFSDENRIIDEPEEIEVYERPYPFIYRLRFFLMFLLGFYLFGIPSAISEMVQTVCSFIPVAFFIISGYVILGEEEGRRERIVRTIKRTAIVFAALVVVYFVINYWFYGKLGIDVFTAFQVKRVWFNLIVFNVWPFEIGYTIWYVQAILYAYIIIYFIDRFNLLKYDLFIALGLLVITLLTGEFSGVIGFSFLGYSRIPGCFLTLALPYLLIGGAIFRYEDIMTEMPKYMYFFTMLFGFVMMIFEVTLLNYAGVPGSYNHLLGMPVVSISLLMLFNRYEDVFGYTEDIFIPTGWACSAIYYLYHPMATFIALAFASIGFFRAFSPFVPYIAWCVCYIIAVFLGFILRVIGHKRNKKETEE